jgi:glycosyltransferase involved in cell wall biosynthesis
LLTIYITVKANHNNNTKMKFNDPGVTRAARLKLCKKTIGKGKRGKTFDSSEDAERFEQALLEFTNDPVQRSGLKVAVLGYRVPLVGQWDPSFVKSGLPGSEECAVYATEELAKRGIHVDVYMDPPAKSWWGSPLSNPRWVEVSTWDSPLNTETYDLVLMWRRMDAFNGKKRGKKVFFWPHDSLWGLPPGGSYPPFLNFDGVVVLSEHHQRQLSALPNYTTVPYAVCGNGIVPEQFINHGEVRPKLALGYFSNYARGLQVLISAWPTIREQFPEATLAICYGRQTWNTMPQQALNDLIAKIEQYKDQGVTEYGKVGHEQLATIMKQTSIWAYPCLTEAETFCITAVKAQAAGCIPAVCRVGALFETVHPDAPGVDLTVPSFALRYTQVLLSVMHRIKVSNSAVIQQEREKYIEFGNKFSWKACVDKWLQLYENVK